MKKVLGIIVGVVVALVILLTLVVMFALGPIIKTAVEQVGPQALGAPVTVEQVKVSPFTGMVHIQGFLIGNPEGFKTPSAVELKQFRVQLKLASLLSDTIIIEEILIEGPQITLEAGLGGTNIGAIQKNVEAFAGGPKEKPAKKPTEEPAPESTKPAKKVVVEHFLFTGGQVNLSMKLMGGRSLPVPLPTIEMRDIGKDSGGASPAEVIKEITDRIMSTVTDAAGKVTDLGADALKGAGAAAGAALEGGKDALKEAGAAASGLLKGVGGLLKKE